MSLVLKSQKGHIGYLSLNNPQALNALSNAMMRELVEGLKAYDEDENIRCIVIKGEGRAFCSGHDVNPADNPYHDIQGWRERARICNEVPFTIWNCKTPVIAQVHKYCLGGACDLAAVCDLTIASEDALFGEPEIQFNSHPPFPMLAYVVGYKAAKEIILTGDKYSAQEALRMGLVNKVVPMEELEQTVYEYAMKLVKMPVPAVRTCKQTINRIYEMQNLYSGVHLSEESFAEVLMSPTPEFEEFCKVRDSEGLKAAFKWRDEFFADSEQNAIVK